jgi:hypothetical protein
VLGAVREARAAPQVEAAGRVRAADEVEVPPVLSTQVCFQQPGSGTNTLTLTPSSVSGGDAVNCSCTTAPPRIFVTVFTARPAAA